MNTLKLALEALQSCKDKRDVLDWHQVFDTKLVNGAIEKLQAEIARDGEAVGQVGGTGVVSWFNGMPKRGTYIFTRPAPKTLSDDIVIMPKTLTAENGAKGLLIGEFFAEYIVECQECEHGEIDGEICEECNGASYFTQKLPIQWHTIKAIYDKAVSGLQHHGIGGDV